MEAQTAIPDHVPREMVRDFSFWTTPGMAPTPNGCPQAALSFVHAGPPIFYAPNNTYDGRGTWVVVSAEDQRQVLQDPETFSSVKNTHEASLGESVPLIPLEIDPPLHTLYRRLLNPLLSPKAVQAIEPIARERAVELIEGFREAGTCEIMEDFAFPFAVSIFLRFLGLPYSRSGEFLGWANDMLHGTPEQRATAHRTVHGFMSELAELRRKEPSDDFMSFLIGAEIDGRPLTDKEIRGIGFLLFVAGLDTVAAAIGYDVNYLARTPEAQQRLRDEPTLIGPAVEEMLRAFPTVQLLRVATRDVDFLGAPIKAGDWVSCATMIANRDPREFHDPDRIDFDRENNRHVAFAYGPHRCLGSHLARRELVIGLEELLKRIPAFRIKEGTAPITFGGFVFGIENLILDWS